MKISLGSPNLWISEISVHMPSKSVKLVLSEYTTVDSTLQSGVNGLLDVARQTYKEANADAYQLVTDLGRMSFSRR